MVYQNRLEKMLLQIFAHPENSEVFSYIVNIFEVNNVAAQKKAYW